MQTKNKLIVSDRAHLTLLGHLQLDAHFEKKQFIGTTLKGIGPTYALKCFRFGLRVGDLLDWEGFVVKHSKFYSFLKDTFGLEVPAD